MNLAMNQEQENHDTQNIVPLGSDEIRSILKSQSESVFEDKNISNNSNFVKKSLIDIALDFESKQNVKENLDIDSKAYNDLSPKMKDAVSDVFRQVEKSTGDIIKRFEGAVDKVSQHYNINTTELNDYFDKEVIEQLGEK